MSQRQHLGLEQTTGMYLTQQQLRYVRMLEYNSRELEDAVERELEDNPALGLAEEPEREDSQRSERHYWQGPDRNALQGDYVLPDTEESLIDNLVAQLSEKNLDATVEAVARYIIGSLDSNGYLLRPLPNLVDDLAFSEGMDVSVEVASKALDVVRSLDPPGIGATSLQDCLLMQLYRMKPTDVVRNAVSILRFRFDAFSKMHLHRLISSLRLNEREVREAMQLIRSLNPKPGASVGHESDAANIIVPDFIVRPEGDEVMISLNNNIPELKIERSFSDAMEDLKQMSRSQRKGSEFVMTRYRDAKDFIKILTQRQQTMLAVMTAIVKIQKEYFMTEDVYCLKPMMIKDIAEITGLDLSVVSRATSNKYVSTPAGNFPLRFFFSDAKSESKGDEADTGQEILTNRKIEAEIRKMVEAEDKKHPLSDEKIREEMLANGYDVSRRTIAKYRGRLGIPVARLRRQ